MGKLEKICATVRAIILIVLASSRGVSGPQQFVMGGIGGGIGAIVGGLIRTLVKLK